MSQAQGISVFYARTSMTWGFTVRYKGVSAAQPSYPVPPPTTVIGAFGYALARILDLNPYQGFDSEKVGNGYIISFTMKVFLESTITASAALVKPKGLISGLSIYLEPTRLIASAYKGGTELTRIKKAKIFTDEFFADALNRMLPVQATGSAYAPELLLDLLWIVDADKLSKELGLRREEFDKIASKAVHGVVRVGSKEGLVAIQKAGYYTKASTLSTGGGFRTRFYVPAECVEPLDREFVAEIELPGLSYSPRRFYIAAQLASQNIIIPLPEDLLPPQYRLLSGCTSYTVPLEGAESLVGVVKRE